MIEITNIKVSLKQGSTEESCLKACKREATRLLDIRPQDIACIALHRKSIDARKKSNVHFILSAHIQLSNRAQELACVETLDESARKNIHLIDSDEPHFPQPDAIGHRPVARPVVVGAGCAGLFAALTLAHAGLEPLLIERGADATRRTRDVEHFNRTGELNESSNIQFGLGGAGTFSDGKLTTGTKNPLHRLILQTFVEAGAPREILWDAKPHIGSDILPAVVTDIVTQIEGLGGEVRFNTQMVDIARTTTDAISSTTVSSTDAGGIKREETIATSQLILACGHSARDVFALLSQRGFSLQRKTFPWVFVSSISNAISTALNMEAPQGIPPWGPPPTSLSPTPKTVAASFRSACALEAKWSQRHRRHTAWSPTAQACMPAMA